MTGLWASLVGKVGKVVAWIIVGAVVLALLFVLFQIQSCRKAQQQAIQTRLDQGQLNALGQSAADAINTQGQVNANEQAGADLTRTNDQEIRNAKGANQAVDPDVNAAGLRSLCRRAAYRNTERCRLLNAPAS